MSYSQLLVCAGIMAFYGKLNGEILIRTGAVLGTVKQAVLAW